MGETKKGVIKAVCISERRGTQKTEVPYIKLVPGLGIEGDAHAGSWHRQVSLISYEKIEEFRARGAEVENGAFGENIIAEGFDFRRVPVGTGFRAGDALLEITQIGKECHTHCTIYHQVTLGGTGKDTGKRHPTIGNNVLIGAGASVLGPVVIGNNVRVAAGSVVLNNVPNNATTAGVPARVVSINGDRVPSDDLNQRDVPDLLARKFEEVDKRIRQLEEAGLPQDG